MKKEKDVLFDLEEEFSEEESSSEESTEDFDPSSQLVISEEGSSNISNKLMVGGVIATLIAAGIFFVKKLQGEKSIDQVGASNYDPVNFEF